MKTSSFKLTATDGINLFVRNHQIKESKKTIILIHGLGEHSGRYIDFIQVFNSQQISVFAMVTRGHGTSGGKRGQFQSDDQLMYDIQSIIHFVLEETPNQKQILLAHSVGGNLVINYSLKKSLDNIVWYYYLFLCTPNSI